MSEPPLFILKTAADGTFTWLRTPAVDSLAEPVAVQPTADGGFLFTGMTQSWGTLRLVRVDAEGNVLLDRTYYELDNLNVSDAIETADGNIVLLCRLRSFQTLYLIKTGAGGDTLWSRPLGKVNSYNVRDVLTELPSGKLLVATAGYANTTGTDYDLRLIRALPSGDYDTAYNYSPRRHAGACGDHGSPGRRRGRRRALAAVGRCRSGFLSAAR